MFRPLLKSNKIIVLIGELYHKMTKKSSKKDVKTQVEQGSNTFDMAAWLKEGYVFKDGPRGQLSQGKKRGKSYTLIVFIDDLPDELKDGKWKQLIIDLGFKCAFSPLHDRDVNADGTPKKPHYHVVIYGSSNWISLIDLIDLVRDKFQGKGVPVPEKVPNLDGLLRYFTHIDNPDKAQYSKSGIECHGGLSIERAYRVSKMEHDVMVRDMISLIRDNEEITDFFQVVNVALDRADKGDDKLFEVIKSNGWLLEKYISSRRYYMRDRAEALAKAEYKELKDKANKTQQELMSAEHQEVIQAMIKKHKDDKVFMEWLAKNDLWKD